MSKKTDKADPLGIDYIPQMIPVADIEPSPANPRKSKDNEIKSLADSILGQGLLHPITVRHHPTDKNAYEIVSGERRWRAFKTIKEFEEIPAFVRQLTDQQAHEITVTENLQREDLSPLEEAAGIATLLGEGKDAKEIADRLGKPLSWVVRRAKLQNLSPKWRKAIADEDNDVSKWSAAHLELIARYEINIQDELLVEVSGWCDMSAKDLEKRLGDRMMNLSAAPWKLDQIVDGIESCAKCQKRSSVQVDLFGEIKEKGRAVDKCLDGTCWAKKHVNFIERKAREIQEENKEIILLDCAGYNEHKIPDGHDLKKTAVAEYKIRDCKKSDPGAKQALVIDGIGAGKIRWVKPAWEGASMESAVTGPKSLKEKRAQLDKRRVIRFIEKIIGMITGKIPMDGERDKPAPEIQTGVISKLTDHERVALAFTFGATAADRDDREKDEWDTYKAALGAKIGLTAAAIELTRGTFERVAGELRGESMNTTPDREFTDKLCDALHLNKEVLWAEILEENPEPKSWAKEEPATKKPKAKAAVNSKTTERKCRVCGCTEDDCSQCIEKTGTVCRWVEDDLCSACVDATGKRYLYHGEEIFVSPGLGGKEFGTFKKTKSGAGIKRIVIDAMPMVPDRERAQANLDNFAVEKKLEAVE